MSPSAAATETSRLEPVLHCRRRHHKQRRQGEANAAEEAEPPGTLAGEQIQLPEPAGLESREASGVACGIYAHCDFHWSDPQGHLGTVRDA